MFSAVRKQQYLFAISTVYVNLLCADKHTHTFSRSPYLANRIWQIGKQTAPRTDWQTDGHAQPKQIGQTHRQRYAHIQQRRGGNGHTHARCGEHAHCSADLKASLVFLFAESVAFDSCVTHLSKSKFLLHFQCVDDVCISCSCQHQLSTFP